MLLTAEEMRDAELLERAWDRLERERKDRNQIHSKKHLAGLWGVHPSNVSQYINGHIPLNVKAKLWFAQYLEMAPIAIWPDFQFSAQVPGELPPEAIEIALAYMSLDDDIKPTARHLMESLPKQPRR